MRNARDDDGLTGWQWLMVLGPIGIIGLAVMAPVILVGITAALAPGFNTCTAEIKKLLRDPDTAKFFSAGSLSSASNPHIRGYDIEVNATNGFGGRTARTYRCVIDESGEEATYRIVY